MSNAGVEPNEETSLGKEIHDALRDTGVLLEFLGRASDGRLQSQFEDTRDQVEGAVSRKISPPCKNYWEFLNRLSKIRAGDDGKQKISAEVLSQAEEKQPLSDVAFLLWARDFLAGVAAPATADTILMTEAYMERRARSLWHKIWKYIQCKTEKTEGARTKPPGRH